METINLHGLIKHLATCNYAITAEGGSAHIAAALGLSVCVISGTKNQSYWKPHAKNVNTLLGEKSVTEINHLLILKSIYSFVK